MAGPSLTAAAAIERYHQLLAADPRAAAEQGAWLQDAFRHAGITFDGEPMASFLRPHFVERGQWEALRQDGYRLLELAARAARLAFGGDARRLCAWMGTPEAEVPWNVLDPGGPDVVLSRLDAFVTPQGPRFIEINSDAPAGFGYGDRMADVLRQLPVFQEFAKATPVEYHASGSRLVEAVVGTWRAAGGQGSPVVGIVDWQEVKTRADQLILKEAFEASGFVCRVGDPRDVDVVNGRLCLGSEPIDVVYRRAVLSELVEHEDEVRGFLRGYAERRAVFVNSFRCRISEDKAFFALLTDEAFAHLFTAEERALVLRLVPWTRKVEERRTVKDGRPVDLVAYVMEHRESLVLKPAHGYGGQSVFVGDETPPAEWQAAVGAGVGRPWVVQERVAIPVEEFPVWTDGALRFEPLKVNANPFYVRGAPDVGAVTRASRSSVINVSAGGGSAPTFVVG